MMSYFTSFLAFGLSLVLVSGLGFQHNESGNSQSLLDVSGVKVELRPTDRQVLSPDKTLRFTSKLARFKVVATNNSNGLIRTLILDTYYQNRPKLYRGDQLIPYRREIASLLTSKDKDPHFSLLGDTITLYPTKTTDLEELNLADWYNQLEPGVYRISNRYRFEIYGKWSSQSEEIEFEIVPDPK